MVVSPLVGVETGKEVNIMATYVILGNFTEQGLRNVKNTVERAQAFQAAAAQAGVQVQGIWWTMGQHDFVAVVDAPDDETISAGLLMQAMHGNFRSQTLRAFDAEAMARIVGKIP
jgi:uncharacterized protein with GYD domain